MHKISDVCILIWSAGGIPEDVMNEYFIIVV